MILNKINAEMKFTKEEFSEKLKSKLTNMGKKPMQQSERTFKRLIEKIYSRLEKVDDDSELDDVVLDYYDDFAEIEANINKDKADFVKDWNKNHPDPEDKEPDKPNVPPTDDKFDKLLKKFEELERRETERDKAEKVSKLRKQLKSELRKDGIEDSEWLDSYLDKLNITEETDIETEKTDALKLFNRVNSSTNTITPSATGGKGGDVDLSYLE